MSGRRRPRYAAHRGGAALWPENSLLAFRNALALGAPLLELDVHPTRDGEIAVIHDATLERTTDGRGPVAAAPAATLRGHRLKGPDGHLTDETVPMLGDVLALVALTAAGLLVEIKGPGVDVRYERAGGTVRAVAGPRYDGLEAMVLAALGRAALAARTAVMAFDPDVVRTVRARAPHQRTTLLVARGHVEQAGARPADTIEWARAAGATEVGLEHTLVDGEVVRAAAAAGMPLGVWTVNDEPAMRRYVGLGVDILTTDRPDLARQVLQEVRTPSP